MKNLATQNVIGIIDYGLGNIFSIERAFEIIGVDTVVVKNPEMLKGIEKIVLPGVGNFSEGINNLNNLGFSDYIQRHVESNGFILGICLGMQLLLTSSSEGGGAKGLDIIKGKVRLLDFNTSCSVPHIGWNDLFGSDMPQIKLFNEIETGSACYFVHSYHADIDIDIDIRKVYTEHCGNNILAAYNKGNVYAVQFHPEKSQNIGLKILKNFVKL
jgi:glutamine amidotransferase